MEVINNRKCILWGKQRHIYEFLYMFDYLDYYGYITEDGNSQYEIPLNLLMASDREVLGSREYLIIICDIEMDEYIAVIQNYNLVEGTDYIQFETCFGLLDPFNEKVLNNRKIAIWGTGETEKNLQQACIENGYSISADLYIDSNLSKSGTQYSGCLVKTINEIKELKRYFIIVASIYYYNIREELNKLGFIEGKDYLPFSCFMSKPSAMLKDLVRAKELTDFYCNRPYKMLSYAWFGAYPCCSTWVKYPIGNPAADSPQECWNSVVAKLYRLSVDTSTYCFCKKDACGLMGNHIHGQENATYCQVPEEITLGLDYTCNLNCTSCRDKIQVASGEQLKVRERFADEIIQTGWLEKAKRLELSSTGEALFSKIDRKILFSNDRCKRESIVLLSNGLLLNEKNLDALVHHFKRIHLNISIDAATEKTYNRIRRGGDWNFLQENLNRVCTMRINHEIEYVEIRMVVQKNNYKEMIDFIKMGKRYHVDQVVFTKLRNWDMYTTEDYLEQAMLNTDGELQAELKHMLQMDIFQDKIVQIAEFKPFLVREKVCSRS